MADYPGSLYTKTTVTDNVTDVLAAQHNDQEDEILAVETELGTDVAGSATDLKTRLAHSVNDAGYLEFDAATELTISSGAITVAQNFHKLDTEADAATDDLDTINGESAGLFVVFRTVNDARDVVFKHGVDNIYCAGGTDITLESTNEFAFGIYDDNLVKWMIAKGAGGDDITGSGSNNYIAVFSGASAVEGTDDLQWDATTLTIGDGTAGRDYIISINGQTNDGVITWMEDEDYFKFGDGVLMNSTEAIYFRDTAISIASATDGHLDLTADVSIDLNTAADTDLVLNFAGTTNSGVITWMEDEDYFKFGDEVLIDGAEKINLRDTAIGIYSQADTYMDLFADGSIRIGDSSAGAPTNFTEFKSDGEINLHGTARVTKCITFESPYLGIGGTAPDVTVLGNYVGYSYDIADDSVITIPMPCNWADGTDLTITCRWYINEAYATNSGEVNWQAAWSAVPNDESEAVDAPTHSGTATSGDQNIPATAKFLTQTTVGTISGASLASIDELGITFERIALVGGADPTADPVITCIGIQYVADKIGIAT